MYAKHAPTGGRRAGHKLLTQASCCVPVLVHPGEAFPLCELLAFLQHFFFLDADLNIVVSSARASMYTRAIDEILGFQSPTAAAAAAVAPNTMMV